MRSPKAAPEDELHHRPPAAGATPPPAQQAAGRRKGTASRAWLVVSDCGAYLEEVGKHSIMRRTGLPARDLRVLDPLLSYPSTILGRERAIVINLEHIKAIITATEVLIPNSKDPMVAPFVQDLQSRVSSSYGAPQQAAESSDVDGEAMAKDASMGITKQNNMSAGETPEGSPTNPMDACKHGGTKVLPFEFRALEVCLESACRCLESETSTLEQEAYPALDELTSKISTLNLERVRQIKSRLVTISGRVQKVRDELEQLLDDDMDMAEMYLSEKLAQQRIGESSSRVDIDHDSFEVEEDRDEDFKDETEYSHGSLGCFKPNIEELEMLLEAYFVQIDGTLNKLSHVAESRNQILLPFEFRVLEICLESSYRRLEAEALTLEQEAYPALDEMTSKISTLNLEHVRSIKSRLVAVSWHVQTVRDELEHLLDDDNDMAEMYLTKKLAHQHNGESSSRVKVDNDAFQLEEDRHEDFKDQIESSHGNLPTLKPNVQELEMLLETYFEQMDGTLNKLSRLRDYVDITEDCVKIMQDEKQNQLLEVGVMLSIGTVVVTAGVVVVGIFGQNIHIKLYDVPTYAQFWETTFGTIGVCLILYILAIGLAKRSGLLR